MLLLQSPVKISGGVPFHFPLAGGVVVLVEQLVCHRVACQGTREPLETWSRCTWPPGLVEQSRPGVGKILFGLLTNPSSMYPRVVSTIYRAQSAVRNTSVSSTGYDQPYYDVQ